MPTFFLRLSKQGVLIVPLWNWNWHRRWLKTHRRVLIVPLWNWNTHPARPRLPSNCFNRTFMELKLHRQIRGRHIFCFNRTFMELKWAQRPAGGGGLVGFNRTFMELKYPKKDGLRRSTIVLIVPLWNWNRRRLALFLHQGRQGFNRTFMELKWAQAEIWFSMNVVLIVPLWNWNCCASVN